ncbi:MAG: universal stress protein [Planctomycetia bacterium]|nr:universal stress protein [Planctomycetia bacterium]
MKILVGVDGSPSSLDAVRLVARLVDPVNDSVALYFSPAHLEATFAGRSHAIVDGAAAALFEEARGLLPPSLAAKNVEMIASSKAAAVGILESAAGWHADLVAVGARGTGSVERLLLGSVSRAVLHGATLPVLVVRTPPAADRGLRVLVCHHPRSGPAVAAALGRFHWPQGTNGRVIGVTESLLAGPLPAWLERRVRDPDTSAIAQAWEKEHADEVAALAGTLSAFRRALPEPFRDGEPIVAEGNPGEKIVATARDEASDLIVVGRTPTDVLTRWLLGSTSEAVLTRSHASVLVVPVDKAAG